MKKFLKSKKFLASAAVAMSMIIAAGGAYAWFTREVEGVKVFGQFGRLNVTAEFDGFLDENEYLEPGMDEVSLGGKIKNTGSLDAFLKVDLSAKVKIFSDENGNPLPNDGWRWATQQSSIDAMGIDYAAIDEAFTTTDWDMFIVAKDLLKQGVYYIYLNSEQNMGSAYDVTFDVTVAPDGPSLGNVFQGAQLILGDDWKATQAIPGAMEDVMGITQEYLTQNTQILFSSGTLRTASSAPQTHDEALAYFLAKLGY